MRSERAELAALAAETLRHGTWNEPQALTSEKVLLQCDSKSYWPAAVAKIADFLFKFDRICRQKHEIYSFPYWDFDHFGPLLTL